MNTPIECTDPSGHCGCSYKCCYYGADYDPDLQDYVQEDLDEQKRESNHEQRQKSTSLS